MEPLWDAARQAVSRAHPILLNSVRMDASLCDNRHCRVVQHRRRLHLGGLFVSALEISYDPPQSHATKHKTPGGGLTGKEATFRESLQQSPLHLALLTSVLCSCTPPSPRLLGPL